MKTLKLIAIAITATAFAAPVFAGGDAAQLAAQKRAFEKAYAAKLATNPSKALAGATGPKGQVGPATADPKSFNVGHPSERVRR